ncbi:MAG: hypothetical protein ABIN67_20835 [Ferruginibacter sp.]
MRKVILAIVLFTSCRVQDNKTAHIPLNKPAEVPAKINNIRETPAATQPQENTIAVKEISEQLETADNKPSQVECPASTINTTHNKVECTESNSAPNIGAKAEMKDNNVGASNYEEGYIPFIKQYW